MMDDLQKAYTAYQQALYHLPNPKEPKLWYGIGILYDRYGSLEHAEDAFSSVLRMDPSALPCPPCFCPLLRLAHSLIPNPSLARSPPPDFEKANEIYFRLGIIYKQQHKYPASLDVRLWPSRPLLQACSLPADTRPSRPRSVLQIHPQEPATAADRRRHLVPDRPRLRAAEGGASARFPRSLPFVKRRES